jgi:hypothetical protein
MARTSIGMAAMEEWTTVTRDDKKRVMRKRGRRGPARKSSTVEHRSTTTTAMDSIEDPDVMNSTITKCMEHLRSARFYESLLNAWSSATGSAPKNTVRQIVCYGVGNFSQTSLSHYSAPLWQLACALCLRDHLRSDDGRDIRLLYYEPFSTAFEDTILAGLKVQVLTVNERAKRPIDAVPTLFFMPHCPSELYDNVLWSNWDELAVSTPLIIFGNSLRNHCESLAPTSACPCLHLSLPWLQEQRLECSTSDLKQFPGNFEGAFNDTYLTHFQALDQTPWPERPTETTESGQEII